MTKSGKDCLGSRSDVGASGAAGGPGPFPFLSFFSFLFLLGAARGRFAISGEGPTSPDAWTGGLPADVVRDLEDACLTCGRLFSGTLDGPSLRQVLLLLRVFSASFPPPSDGKLPTAPAGTFSSLSTFSDPSPDFIHGQDSPFLSRKAMLITFILSSFPHIL